MRTYLKKAIVNFIYKDPIASLWLINFTVSPTDTVETYKLSVSNSEIVLEVNEDWLEREKVKEQWFLQMIFHVMFYHFSFKRENTEKLKIAFELAVNHYIGRVLPTDILISDIEELYNIRLERGRDFSYYYDNIPDNVTEKKKSELSLEYSSDGLDGENNSEIVNKIFNESYQQIKGTHFENFYKERITKRIEKPKLNSLKIISSLVLNRGKKATTEIDFFNENPYYPESVAVKNILTGSILIGIDTSGSINLDQYMSFLSQINHLFRKYDIEIVHCDTEIRYKGRFNPKDKVIRGGGGTDFTPVIEYYNQSRHKTLLYFTDLHGETNVNPKKPVFWITTERDYNRAFIKTPNSKIIFI